MATGKAPTKQKTDLTSAADVEQGIALLKEEMSKAPVMHIANPWANRILDAGDLDPYALPQQKNQKSQKQDQGKEGELNFEELFKGRMTQKDVNDIIAKYKAHPERIQSFLKGANAKHRVEQEIRQAEELNRRLVHRKQMAVLTKTVPAPFVMDPNQQYRKELKNGSQTRQNQLKKLILKQEERELDFALAQASRERKLLTKLNAQQSRVPSVPILPVPYVMQRNKLEALLFVGSRLSVLYVVSSKYSQINAQNQHILKNAVLIQRQARRAVQFNGLKRRREAAEQFQRLLRRKQTQVQVQQRLQCLQEIRRMLLQNYNRQVLLGTVSEMQNTLQTVQLFAQAKGKTLENRLFFVRQQLTKCDFEIAGKECQKELWEADAKEKSKTKKKDAAAAKKLEDFEPTEAGTIAKMLEEHEIDIIAHKVLFALETKYLDLAIDNFNENCNRNNTFLALTPLIPDDASATRVLTSYREHKIGAGSPELITDWSWVDVDRFE